MKKIYTLLMVMFVATCVVAQTQVYKGTQVKMTATPKTGYHFCQWNDGNLNATRTVTVNSNVNYVATFASNSSQHTITTAVNNANFGAVLGGGSYDYNSTISLVSQAAKGYHFLKWQDGDKNATRSIKVLRDAKYTATFAPDTFKVVANVNDAKMGSTRVVGSKAYKETTKLYVDTVVGYSFIQWNDGIFENPRLITVLDNVDLVAELDYSSYTLTTKVDNSVRGSVTSGGSVQYTKTKSLTATPKYGYKFSSWTVSGTGSKLSSTTTNPTTFTMGTANATVTANFEPLQYKITLTASSTAMGSVSGGGSYDYNTSRSISATPKTGYKFVKWSDGVTTASRNITLTKDTSLVAEFDYNSYTLTTKVDNSVRGSVTSGGSVQYTKTKSLTATPKYGYKFSSWSVSGTGSKLSSTTANPTTFTMGTANATVTANFAPLQYKITLTASSTAMGSVSGGGSYDYNTSRSISATPKTGYKFVKWSDGVTTASRNITLTKDTSLVAEFDYNDYILTTQVNNSDRGSVTEGGSVQYTKTKELTATPKYGYVFKNWSVSGTGSSLSSTTANPTTFTMGTANATVTANFDYDKFEITATTEQPQMGTVRGSGRYNYLSEQNISAEPGARYRFVGWSDGNTENPRSITITQDETYTAIFEQTHAILTVNPSEKNAGTFVGPGLYEVGEKVFLQANPAPYYRFVKWSDGSTQNPRRITMTEDITLIAYFLDELAEESSVNSGQVLVEPDSTNAKFSWPQTEGSKSYSLEIKKDGVTFCTLEFNEYGQLAGIDFTTRAMTKGFQFKVTGLDEDSDYHFSLKAKDVSENVIASYAGDFSTRAGSGSSVGESNLGEEEDNPSDGNGGEGTAVSENAHTVLVYGLDMHVIVQGAATQVISVYNVAGQLLETRVAVSDKEVFDVYPEGVYIVNVGESTYKVVVK